MVGQVKPFGERTGSGRRVSRIAKKRMTHMRHVHAKLMCAPGDGGKLKLRNQFAAWQAQRSERAVAADGALTIFAHHAGKAIRRFACDGSVDGSVSRGGDAVYPGFVRLLKQAVRHLLLEVCLCEGKLGKEDDAGGFSVQSVYGVGRRIEIMLYTAFQRVAAV